MTSSSYVNNTEKLDETVEIVQILVFSATRAHALMSRIEGLSPR